MSSSKKLFKNTLIYTVGNFGSKILSFLLLPILSYYLLKEELGIYDLIITTVSFFVPLITLQLGEAAYRWLLASNSDSEKQLVILSSSVFLIFTTLTIFQLLLYFLSYFYDFEYYGYFSIIVITSSILPFIQRIARGLEKIKLFASAGILNAVLVLLTNLLLLSILELKLEALFIALVISNSLTIVYLVFKLSILRRISFSKVNFTELNGMLRFSLPLIPNTISWWLINVSDKYLILLYLSAEVNGIYAISSRFPTILLLLNSVFLLAWQDQTIVSKLTKSQSEDYNSKIFNAYLNFELSTVLLLICSSEFLIYFLVDSKFGDAYRYMPILFLGVGFSAFSGYFGAAFLKEKKTKTIFISSLVGGLINILLCFVLLEHIGLFASAIGTLVSFIIVFLIRYYQSRSFFSVKINFSKLILLSLLALLCSYLVLLDFLILKLSLIVLSIIFFFYLNNHTLKYIYKNFSLKFQKK